MRENASMSTRVCVAALQCTRCVVVLQSVCERVYVCGHTQTCTEILFEITVSVHQVRSPASTTLLEENKSKTSAGAPTTVTVSPVVCMCAFMCMHKEWVHTTVRTPRAAQHTHSHTARTPITTRTYAHTALRAHTQEAHTNAVTGTNTHQDKTVSTHTHTHTHTKRYTQIHTEHTTIRTHAQHLYVAHAAYSTYTHKTHEKNIHTS